MRVAGLAPRVHLFVCENQRDADSPLGPGCGVAGRAVFDALKEAVAERRAYASVWVTSTACMGVCPKEGATVSVYPAQRILTEVKPHEARPLFDELMAELAGGDRS